LGPSAGSPFISPDSRWVGFFDQAEGTLKKVSMTGGPAIAIGRAPGMGALGPRGASWGPDDAIVFATNDPATGLFRVPAGGGEPTVLTTLDAARGEQDHVFPSVLPDGRAVLFTITAATGGLDAAQVAVLDLQTGQRTTIIRGGAQAEYVAPATGGGPGGFLVYAASGTLRAVRFDPVRLEVLSDPVPVVEQVAAAVSGAAQFSVSRTGALIYQPGTLAGNAVTFAGGGANRPLLWVDRRGREEPIAAPPRAYLALRLSPDGTRLARRPRSGGRHLDLGLRQADTRSTYVRSGA
jgi:hypothetical protein